MGVAPTPDRAARPATAPVRRSVTGRLTTVVGSHRGRAVGVRHVDLSQIRGTESRLGAAFRPASARCPIAPAAGPSCGCHPPAVDLLPGTPEEESVARRAQRQSGARRTAPRNQRRVRDRDNEGIIPVLARAVREVESAVQRGRVMPSVRTKFQVVALLVREERARVQRRHDQHRGPARRAAQAARRHRHDPGQDRRPRHLAARAARRGRRRLRRGPRPQARHAASAAGLEPAPEERRARREPAAVSAATERRVVPQSVVSRQLANPFLAPDFSAAGRPRPGRAGSPAGSCSARCSAPSSTPAAGPRPAWRCPSRPRAARTRRPRADARTRPRSSPPPRPATAPSCSPTSPAWARPRRRCSPRRRPTPTRCWWSSRTSSRPTGPARPGSGPRTAPPP